MLDIQIKKKNSAILILNIFLIQLFTSVILYYLHLISNYFLIWSVVYYVLTFFCAIAQSGISDSFGRKKNLFTASLSVLLAGLYLGIMFFIDIKNIQFHSFLLKEFLGVFPICFFLGISGNAIPIARAGIADLKIHDFRTAMGWSTIAIGFGWIAAVLLGLILSFWKVLFTIIFLQLLILYIIKKKFIDSKDNIRKTSKDFKKIFNVISNSYKWFGSMFLTAGGSAAILAYLLSETTFYQIFSSNEIELQSLSIKIAGVLMAVGYALGVLIQWIMSFSDKKGIKYGIIISLISLFILFAFNNLYGKFDFFYFSLKNSITLKGFFEFFFAFGNGFFVPSLFSLMSKKLKVNHFGKLFGAIDSTDTLALGFSFFTFYLKNKLILFKNYNNFFSVFLFIISCIFYIIVIKKFSSYEKKS
ncbi:MAG: hypothetical protein K1060chlam5_00598 [Candidatus Anoxychlamydiales bacterium]|nr:hypothetical protein [Candidatus Anoxychlamydiales bacterium]